MKTLAAAIVVSGLGVAAAVESTHARDPEVGARGARTVSAREVLVAAGAAGRLQFWDVEKGETFLYRYHFGPNAWLDLLPAAVILDEAIEIVKKFGSEDSGRFINGILDGIRKKVESGEFGMAPGGGDPG